MKVLFHHKLMSSFLLWFDHELLKEGVAFNNHSSLFYDVPDRYSNRDTYGLPFKQIVSDVSIPNATVMSGVYVNDSFTNVGSGELIDINYNEGWAYFSSSQSAVISGDYAVKEFGVSLTDLSEEKLLFETQYRIKPRITQGVTGLAIDEITLPHIFLKNISTRNDPFAFGGWDQTVVDVRAIVIGSNQFLVDGVESIFTDANAKNFCIFEQVDMPLNALGGWHSGIMYNYEGLSATHTGDSAHIEKVTASKINIGELSEVNPAMRASFIDFTITEERTPRS